MTVWPVFLPHGARCHATLDAPLNVGEPSPCEPRTRRTLCGRLGYRGGSPLAWDFVRILYRCRVCERAAKRWSVGA